MTTYYLSSLDSIRFELVRTCVVERTIAFDTGKEALVATIEPPVIGQDLDRADDISTVVLAARHEGTTLDPVSTFPCFVFIATSRHGCTDLRTPIRADDLTIMGWGELYRTEEAARTHSFE